MNDEACEQHTWGEAEMCETSLGNLLSPVCRYCGAVKLELERRAHERQQFSRRLEAEGIKTNMPAKDVRVHPFQTEFLTDV